MPQIISPSWIIPVNSEDKVLANYSLVINDGRIIDILATDTARKKYNNLPEKIYKNKAILPGFINAHTHTPMVLLRGLGDSLCLQDWLNKCIWPAEKALMSDQFIEDGMQLGIAEMLGFGNKKD